MPSLYLFFLFKDRDSIYHRLPLNLLCIEDDLGLLVLLPSARITGLCNHTWLMQCWGQDPELHACRASMLPPELEPQPPLKRFGLLRQGIM